MKYLILLLTFLLLTTCKKEDRITNCNFLADIGVNRTLNLSLPEYSQLMFTNNPVYVPNEGNAGIYVNNTGNDNIRAWDAADPNHVPGACSFLEREGILVTCGCADANTYDLLNGLAVGVQLPCALKEYRVTISGNNLIISN